MPEMPLGVPPGMLPEVLPEVLLALLLERLLLGMLPEVLLSGIRGRGFEQVLGDIPDDMVQEELDG